MRYSIELGVVKRMIGKFRLGVVRSLLEEFRGIRLS